MQERQTGASNNMGIVVRANTRCGCEKKNTNGEHTDKIFEKYNTKVNSVEYVFKCNKCGKNIYLCIGINYIDSFTGVRLR